MRSNLTNRKKPESPLSYSSFTTLASIQNIFGLERDENPNLFTQTPPRQPSDRLAMG
ncbi:hypothetical protein PN466_07585 [Roseofilum reptotaenium CS-1145]|uniref:hypothetical protein n=1 Tax=Roseofilum reptotaenium TaxID=1233427 RepID=UPI00232CA2AF|nr:hypothetical protein [Roseofilum reptotaenium]MDB9516806.1 hypothetical protein [Roseofilum reptotaenium CS-1145]